MAATPLPFDLSDIAAFLKRHPLLIDRDELEEAIFALDNAERDEWQRQQAKNS